MKEGWEIKTLAELADIKGGKRVPKGYHLMTEPTNYPYIRVTDFNDNGSVSLNDIHYINEKVYIQIKNYTISTKDLYVSIAGTIGKTGIIPKELEGANLTENACKLVFRIDVDPKFVYYFTKTDDFLRQAGLNTRVAAMPKIALTRLSTISLPFPKSLPEQHRIVSILDQAFAAIDKAKANAAQNLKNARELFESYLEGVFEEKGEGWEEKTLGEIAQINYGYTEKASYEEIGPKFLRITDIQDNGVNWDTVPFCKCNESELPKFKLETGDIVFARTGATTGKSYMLNNPPNAVFASYLIRLKMISKMDYIPEFVSYFFRTKVYWDRINAGISGSAQGGFNATKLGDLVFHFPKSLTEQQTIVTKLDALSTETKRLEAIYQQKLLNLEELKKSVLQKAFNGEL